MAPALSVPQWFNTDVDPTLEELDGKLVVIEAFQRLCLACVSHGPPQIKSIWATFVERPVSVHGLIVFENHDAITPVALVAFIHEYDQHSPISINHAGGRGNA